MPRPILPVGRMHHPIESRVETSTAVTEQSPKQPLNLTELCNMSNMNIEKQLIGYISGIEAITGTIQELDEIVQQMRPNLRGCSVVELASLFKTTTTTAIVLTTEPSGAGASSTSATNSPIESELTTVESFTDSPIILGDRRSRRATATASEAQFGLPTTNHPTTNSVIQEQPNEDLVRASNDLKTLRKDLSITAEWLKQTNHTVHSAMFRALQAYVSSIERRIDQQRQLFAPQTRGDMIMSKVTVIKEKVANLMEKLKSWIPFKSGVTGRDEHDVSAVPISIVSTTPSTVTIRGSGDIVPIALSSITNNSPRPGA